MIINSNVKYNQEKNTKLTILNETILRHEEMLGIKISSRIYRICFKFIVSHHRLWSIQIPWFNWRTLVL